MALLDKDDPILRKIAQPISPAELHSIWLKELIAELFVVMKETGAVGVAAPQIGISKRVIVFGTAYAKRRRPEIVIPDTALINPEIIFFTQEKENGFEGCLNCDSLFGEVPRFAEIKYSGLDQDGRLIKKRATNLEARILQHEVDHLDGFLFFDRVENKDTLAIYDEQQIK